MKSIIHKIFDLTKLLCVKYIFMFLHFKRNFHQFTNRWLFHLHTCWIKKKTYAKTKCTIAKSAHILHPQFSGLHGVFAFAHFYANNRTAQTSAQIRNQKMQMNVYFALVTHLFLCTYGYLALFIVTLKLVNITQRENRFSQYMHITNSNSNKYTPWDQLSMKLPKCTWLHLNLMHCNWSDSLFIFDGQLCVGLNRFLIYSLLITIEFKKYYNFIIFHIHMNLTPQINSIFKQYE